MVGLKTNWSSVLDLELMLDKRAEAIRLIFLKKIDA